MASRRRHGLAPALSACAWLGVSWLGITHDAHAEETRAEVELVIRGCDAAADRQREWVELISAELPGHTISPGATESLEDVPPGSRRLTLRMDDCQLRHGDVRLTDATPEAREIRNYAVTDLGRDRRTQTLALVAAEMLRSGPPEPAPDGNEDPATEMDPTRETPEPAPAPKEAPTQGTTEAWQRTASRPLVEITPIFGIAAGLDTEPRLIPGVMLGGYLALVGPHGHGGALRGGITLVGEIEGGFMEPLYIYRFPLVGTVSHGIALGLEAGPFVGLIRDLDLIWPDDTPNDLALALGAVMGSELIYRAFGFTAALGARLRWIQPVAFPHESALLAAEASLRIGASFLL